MKPSARFEVFRRDGFACVYCGRRSPDALLEVDHIIAVSSGGSDHLENLATACVDCNRGKAARPLGQPAPVDYEARAARIAEHELQIREYGQWRAAQREREDEELGKLRNEFGAIPESAFFRRRKKTGVEQQWFWDDASARTFLRKLGVHEAIEAIEITASRVRGGTIRGVNDQDRALNVWRFFCGVCWRKIKTPR